MYVFICIYTYTYIYAYIYILYIYMIYIYLYIYICIYIYIPSCIPACKCGLCCGANHGAQGAGRDDWRHTEVPGERVQQAAGVLWIRVPAHNKFARQDPFVCSVSISLRQTEGWKNTGMPHCSCVVDRARASAMALTACTQSSSTEMLGRSIIARVEGNDLGEPTDFFFFWFRLQIFESD